MESRIAAELLYESEATLRMVDTALDELRIVDAEPRPGGPRLTASYPTGEAEAAELSMPPEFCVRAYWQIQDLLESVLHCRQALQSLGRRDVASGVRPDEMSGIDRALALVDRLDSMDETSSAERRALHGDLRRDLLGLLNRVESQTGASESLSAVALQLAEAEARLTKLGHLFEDPDN